MKDSIVRKEKLLITRTRSRLVRAGRPKVIRGSVVKVEREREREPFGGTEESQLVKFLN